MSGFVPLNAGYSFRAQNNVECLSPVDPGISRGITDLYPSRGYTLEWRKRKGDDHTLSHADALAKTASESIEAIVRKRRMLFGGFVARVGEERLPQRVMFGELVGGKGYSGGQEKDWLVHLKDDMLVFGMKFEAWRKAAKKAGRWFRRVEEGAELFMRKWHETKRRRAAERRAKAAAAPSTVGISKRPGGGGGRASCPRD